MVEGMSKIEKTKFQHRTHIKIHILLIHLFFPEMSNCLKSAIRDIISEEEYQKTKTKSIITVFLTGKVSFFPLCFYSSISASTWKTDFRKYTKIQYAYLVASAA